MRLIPVGSKSQKLKVYFVKSGEVGFWLYSPGEALFGESAMLEQHKKALKSFELNNAWLTVEIAEGNRQKLSEYFEKNNPFDYSDEKLKDILNDSELLTLELENYVGQLMRLDVTHPLLREFKDKLNQLLLDNNLTDYQRMLVYACLKKRHVDPNDVEVDSVDPQLGWLDAFKVQRGEIKIGLPELRVEDLDSPLISESLTVALYRYGVNERNGEEYITDLQEKQLKEELELAKKAPKPEPKTEGKSPQQKN